jgi:hypothetical protein
MTGQAVFRRQEFDTATLELGGAPVALSDYATTGLRIVCVGPSGAGKTNAGLLIAEQLSMQGWISVLFDREGDIGALYEPMRDVTHVEAYLRGRHHPILVVPVRHTDDFLHYGRLVQRIVEEERQPVFLMVDEAQMVSASRKRKESIGEASDLMNDFTERGRKRSLDVFVTAHRFSGTLHRSIFANKNLTLIGRQEDPTAWSALAPQFKGSKIGYADLAALAPGEFFCFSRRGVEKIQMPMADALAAVAPKATVVRQALPATFSAWDKAMREMPTDRLKALTHPVCGVLGAIAGLTSPQHQAGLRARRDELEARR